MLDFFMNVQQSAGGGGGGGGGALPNDYTYNQNARKAPAPTHMLAAPNFQGVQSEYRIYDITSLPTITQVSNWNPAGGYNDYLENVYMVGHFGAIKNGYFYVVTYNRDLHVYDVTNPAAVTNLSKIYDSGLNNIHDDCVGVYAHPTKDILWVLSSDDPATGGPWLTTYDISNPASLSIISTVTPYGDPDVSAISRDGERLFYKTGAELVSYGLDASGNPANFQSDPIPGGSFPTSSNLRSLARIEWVQTGSGNNYIVGGVGNLADVHFVIKLGTDHIPDAAAYQETSTVYSDWVPLVFPFPWAESSYSDDLVYFKYERDDTEVQVSGFDPSTNTFSHYGSEVDVTYFGNSGTSTTNGIEGWDQYVVIVRMNAFVSFYEFDPVSNSFTQIAFLSRNTTPDIHDWAPGQVWLFAVP